MSPMSSMSSTNVVGYVPSVSLSCDCSPLSRNSFICALPKISTARFSTLKKVNRATSIHMMTKSTSVESKAPVESASPTPSKTLVCTSLTAPTLLEQLTQSRNATDLGADLVEIRVDLLNEEEQVEWHRLLPALNIPCIVTNRASWEGGKSQMEEGQRLGVLVEAVQKGVSHIDVELKAIVPFIDLCCAKGVPFPHPKTKLILSHHDFEAPLNHSKINELINSMRGYGANVCKIAMTATSALDNLQVFRELREQQEKQKNDCVILAMGELGQPTRVAAGKFGAYLTFASVARGNESAPGQVDLQTLLSVYRFRNVTATTPLYAVLGDPVAQSLSPALHNAAFEHCNLDAAYLPAKVEQEVYAEFVRSAIAEGFCGFSVTIPGKVPVIEAMDSMDPVAKGIGAMNTVVPQPDGTLRGYNTDWVAAMDAIEEALETNGGLKQKRVVCIGAGGAGRALAFGALERGAASVLIVNRSVEKAENLAKDLGERAAATSLEAFNQVSSSEFDVLMNSSSVGMFPKEDETPVAAERLTKGSVVFDAVYNPLKTRLLREAEERDCTTVSGMEMFVRQAAEQFRLWFPQVKAPVDTMRTVVLDKLKNK